jgi:hypothetical protein
MTAKEKRNSIKKTARIAGVLFLITLFLAPFAEFFVRQILIVPGDAAKTVSNIMASESLFRLGIVSGLIYQTVFTVYVLILYKLLKPVNKNVASLMVIFYLVGVPIAMLNLLNQFAALLLLSGADYLKAFAADQLHAQVMLFLDLQEHGVQIAQIFWGLWLFPLGYLVYKSGFLPRVFGILLMIGCFGYLIDSFAFFLLPNYENYEAIFLPAIALLTIPGELLLGLWLLIKGVNVEQWEKRALESA